MTCSFSILKIFGRGHSILVDDPKHGLDQLFPRRIANPGLGGKHRQFAGLPAIAARGLGLGGPARLATATPSSSRRRKLGWLSLTWVSR